MSDSVRLCQTNVGPFRAYVGLMLGPCWVIWGAGRARAVYHNGLSL